MSRSVSINKTTKGEYALSIRGDRDNLACWLEQEEFDDLAKQVARHVPPAAAQTDAARELRELAELVIEITDGQLGKQIRGIAQKQGNDSGLWERTNRLASAVLARLTAARRMRRRARDGGTRREG